MSGKYQLCRVIGKGRTGTVYLALHRELEEYRAIKVVAKSSVGYETFRKEALLLKELRHPGIPVIYDIEEDKEFSYLIEEYLQGNSFESLVISQGPLTRCTVLQYVIQLCSVVHYLHSAGTEPILHLDLQPKNLLVCHETVKLIDFGQASRLTEANKAKQRFGTVGFAAPEQYNYEMKLDERTDIYAIGGLFFYLSTGVFPSIEASPARLGEKLWSREAGRILAACLEPVKEQRYQSVSQLKEDLEQLLSQPVSSRIVAVYGNEPCIGTTHICLSLSSCLSKLKIPNLYEECHSSCHIRKLQENQGGKADSFGIFSAFGCMLKPWYGRQVQFLEHHYPVVIQDRGVWKKEQETGAGKEPAEVYLLVTGGKWWNLPPSLDFLCRYPKNSLLIYNFSDQKIYLKSPKKQKGMEILRTPVFSNPFFPDKEAMEWLKMLLKKTGLLEREQKENFWKKVLRKKRRDGDGDLEAVSEKDKKEK